MKNRRKITQGIILTLLLVVIIVGLAVLIKKYPDILKIFTDQEKIREYITRYGTRAPLILIGLQVFQIVFAPIPGHILGFASGYLFGAVKGTGYCLIGILIGASLAFFLARIFGRQLLKLFISHEKMHHFDNYIVHKGPFVLFVLLLVPFSPFGDILYYLAGLTALPYLVYVLIVLAARIPNNFINNLIGAKAFSFSSREWIIFAAVLAVLTLIFYLNRKKIEKVVDRLVKY